MHARLESIDGESSCANVQGQVGSRAAGAPGHVDKLGSQVVHALKAVKEVGHALYPERIESKVLEKTNVELNAVLGRVEQSAWFVCAQANRPAHRTGGVQKSNKKANQAARFGELVPTC